MRTLLSAPRCMRCELADPSRLVAASLMRSVTEAGHPTSRSIPIRICAPCVRELAAQVRRPPLPPRVRSPWTHRRPPLTNSCVVCGGEFQAWHRRAKYCGERCRQRSYMEKRRLAQGRAN
jgi:hypothetical protein